MRKVTRLAARFPDSVIGLRPLPLEVREQCLLQAPRLVEGAQLRLPRRVQYVHQLAVDVELALLHREVADPYRTTVLVAFEPRQLVLGQPAAARDAVHDSQLPGMTGRRP